MQSVTCISTTYTTAVNPVASWIQNLFLSLLILAMAGALYAADATAGGRDGSAGAEKNSMGFRTGSSGCSCIGGSTASGDARFPGRWSREDAWARPDDLPAWVERGKDMKRFAADYVKLNETFNPRHFDPETWVLRQPLVQA